MKLSHSIARLSLFSCLRRQPSHRRRCETKKREVCEVEKKCFFFPREICIKAHKLRARGHERVVGGNTHQIQFQRCRSCRFADAYKLSYHDRFN